MQYGKKTSSAATMAIRFGILAAVTGAIGYWAFRKFSPTRATGDSAGPTPGEEPGSSGNIGASKLESQWHSLDKEQKEGDIPAELVRAPKDIEQKIHGNSP
jgi:hypothetical protein